MPADADPAALARAIDDARRHLLHFVEHCSDEQWASCPLGEADPRSVAVIADHVADAYGYLGTWIEALARGENVTVDTTVVDDLNARHAASVDAPTRATVTDHLNEAGDRIMALVCGLRPEQLVLGGGRVARLAHIAALHAADHRAELADALRTD
jgi:hypothetical protein